MKNLYKQSLKFLLLEKGELRNMYQPGKTGVSWDDAKAAVDAKKFFKEVADQESLKQLTYIHCGTAQEILDFLKSINLEGTNKDEISTSIHPKDTTPYPATLAQLDTRKPVGMIVEGWITFASNFDLNSGRYMPDASMAKQVEDWWDPIKNPPANREEMEKRADSQKDTSGIPRRPDLRSIKTRKDKEGHMHTNKIMVKGEHDLILSSDMFHEYEYFTQNWPEAIVDNWKVTALCCEDWSFATTDEQWAEFRKITDLGDGYLPMLGTDEVGAGYHKSEEEQ